MNRQFWKGILGSGTVVLMLLCSSGLAFADSGEISSLNGIGTPTTASQQVQLANSSTTSQQASVAKVSNSSGVFQQAPNQAQVIGNLFSGIGVNQQSSEKAHTIMAPLIPVVDWIVSLILGVAALGMLAITAIDLLFLSVPPIRNWLMPEGVQAQGTIMQTEMQQGNGIYGRSGYGGGNGNYGGANQMIQQANNQRWLTQWISDEAKSVISQVAGVQAQSNAMGNFAMNGVSGAQPVSMSLKSVLTYYAKKRTWFLLLFGFIAVLFSTMTFTDLGMMFGQYVLSKLTHFEHV